MIGAQDNKIPKRKITIEDINKLRFLEAEKMIPDNHKIPFVKRIFYKYLSLRLYKYSNIFNSKIIKNIRIFNNSNKKQVSELNNLNNIRRVLVFRYDAIGDYFVTTPVLKWLKENIPNIIIDIVTSNRNNAIISQDVFINKTFIVDEKSNYAKISRDSIKKIKKNKYDLLLSLVVNRTTRAAELATLAAPEAYKVAIGNREIYKQIFDLLVPRQHWISHASVQFYETLLKCFPNKCDISNLEPYIPVGEKYFKEAMKFAQDNNLIFNPKLDVFQEKYNFEKSDGYKYIIININSSIEQRAIPAGKVIEIVKILKEKYPNYVYLITGDPKKKHIIQKVVSDINIENCKSLMLSFNAFSVIVAGASLLISPDTATIHVAAFAEVPIVALYFVYYAIFEWYPLSKNFTIFHADESGYPGADLIAEEASRYLDLNLASS